MICCLCHSSFSYYFSSQCNALKFFTFTFFTLFIMLPLVVLRKGRLMAFYLQLKIIASLLDLNFKLLCMTCMPWCLISYRSESLNKAGCFSNFPLFEIKWTFFLEKNQRTLFVFSPPVWFAFLFVWQILCQWHFMENYSFPDKLMTRFVSNFHCSPSCVTGCLSAFP